MAVPCCGTRLVVRTDPKNGDFEVVSGGRRRVVTKVEDDESESEEEEEGKKRDTESGPFDFHCRSSCAVQPKRRLCQRRGSLPSPAASFSSSRKALTVAEQRQRLREISDLRRATHGDDYESNKRARALARPERRAAAESDRRRAELGLPSSVRLPARGARGSGLWPLPPLRRRGGKARRRRRRLRRRQQRLAAAASAYFFFVRVAVNLPAEQAARSTKRCRGSGGGRGSGRSSGLSVVKKKRARLRKEEEHVRYKKNCQFSKIFFLLQVFFPFLFSLFTSSHSPSHSSHGLPGPQRPHPRDRVLFLSQSDDGHKVRARLRQSRAPPSPPGACAPAASSGKESPSPSAPEEEGVRGEAQAAGEGQGGQGRGGREEVAEARGRRKRKKKRRRFPSTLRSSLVSVSSVSLTSASREPPDGPQRPRYPRDHRHGIRGDEPHRAEPPRPESPGPGAKGRERQQRRVASRELPGPPRACTKASSTPLSARSAV